MQSNAGSNAGRRSIQKSCRHPRQPHASAGWSDIVAFQVEEQVIHESCHGLFVAIKLQLSPEDHQTPVILPCSWPQGTRFVTTPGPGRPTPAVVRFEGT